MNLVYKMEKMKELKKREKELNEELEEVWEGIHAFEEDIQESCDHPKQFIKYEKHVGDDPGSADSHRWTCTICGKELHRGYREDEFGR